MCASTSIGRTALGLCHRDTKLKPGMREVQTDDEGTSLGGLLRVATDGGTCAYRVVGALTSHCVTMLAPTSAARSQLRAPHALSPARPARNLSQPTR